MPISNLAKVFGPTVVGYSKAEPDYTEILGETVIQQTVSFLKAFRILKTKNSILKQKI